MSGAVPLVGGLAGFTGAALKAGDCYVQTRRVAKVMLLLCLTSPRNAIIVSHAQTCGDADERHASPLCFVVVRQITDLAPDAVECCKLARTLALRLTDGLPDGHIATSRDAEEKHTHSAAGVGWGAGEGEV